MSHSPIKNIFLQGDDYDFFDVDRRVRNRRVPKLHVVRILGAGTTGLGREASRAQRETEVAAALSHWSARATERSPASPRIVQPPEVTSKEDAAASMRRDQRKILAEAARQREQDTVMLKHRVVELRDQRLRARSALAAEQQAARASHVLEFVEHNLFVGHPSQRTEAAKPTRQVGRAMPSQLHARRQRDAAALRAETAARLSRAAELRRAVSALAREQVSSLRLHRTCQKRQAEDAWEQRRTQRHEAAVAEDKVWSALAVERTRDRLTVSRQHRAEVRLRTPTV